MRITREAKIGILVLIVIAVFVWGFNFLKGINIFTSTKTYFLEFDNIGELTPSAGVYVSGFKVGSVHDIYFKKENPSKIVVEISIKEHLKIPMNSIGQIYSKDVMGTKAIRLILSNSTDYFEEGETLPSDVEIGFMDQLMPLKNKVESVVLGIDSLLSVTQTTFDAAAIRHIQQSIAHVEAITGNLQNQNERLDNIFRNIESISGNLKNNNAKINNLLANLSSISDSLAQAEIKKTMLQTKMVVGQVNDLLAKIHRGEGTLGQLAANDTLYYNLEAASKNLEVLLKDLNEHPKRYVHFSIFGRKSEPVKK